MDQRAECSVKQFDITRSEVTIFGSFIQNTAFPKVVKILESGILPMEKLVTHQMGLEEFRQRYRVAAARPSRQDRPEPVIPARRD